MCLSGLSDRVKRRERGDQDDENAAMKLVIRVAIYLRVSLEEQAESGHGLHAQEDAARAYAARQGWEVIDVFTDAGISGGSGWKGGPRCWTQSRPSTAATCCCRPSGIELDALTPCNGHDRSRSGRHGARIVSAAGEGTEDDDRRRS